MQSWNWPAIKKCAKLVLNPKLIVPKLSYNRVSEIDWARLRDDYGIRGICFDKDNTITAPYSHNMHFSVLESIKACKQVFDDQIAIFSNSFGSSQFDPAFEKARRFTETTGLNVIEHNYKKPDGTECILNYFKHLKPHEIALVGDRILTDVVMANESGIVSILVSEPLTIQGDNIPAILIRWAEQRILRMITNQK